MFQSVASIPLSDLETSEENQPNSSSEQHIVDNDIIFLPGQRKRASLESISTASSMSFSSFSQPIHPAEALSSDSLSEGEYILSVEEEKDSSASMDIGYRTPPRLITNVGSETYYSSPTTPEQKASEAKMNLDIPARKFSLELEQIVQNVSISKPLDVPYNDIKPTVEEKDPKSMNSGANMEMEHMKLVLAEYEGTMNSMIQENQKIREEHKAAISSLSKEKNLLELELASVESALRDTRQRCEDMRIISEGFRKVSKISLYV
jgi:hypothetical protein